jgi:hypothetical protein
MVVAKQSRIRELTSNEIHLVSGGDLTDSYAFQGGAMGGMAGSIFGSAWTGSTLGASRFGLIGAAIGFSFGLGWGIGSSMYSYATTR